MKIFASTDIVLPRQASVTRGHWLVTIFGLLCADVTMRPMETIAKQQPRVKMWLTKESAASLIVVLEATNVMRGGTANSNPVW